MASKVEGDQWGECISGGGNCTTCVRGKSSELEKPPTNPKEPSQSLRNGKSGVVLIKIPINKIGNKCTRQSWVWKESLKTETLSVIKQISGLQTGRGVLWHRSTTFQDHKGQGLGIIWWNQSEYIMEILRNLDTQALKPAPRKEKIIWVFASELNIRTLYISLNFSTHRIHSARHMLMLSAAYSVKLSWKTSPRCCIEISQGVRPGDSHERKADFGIV